MWFANVPRAGDRPAPNGTRPARRNGSGGCSSCSRMIRARGRRLDRVRRASIRCRQHARPAVGAACGTSRRSSSSVTPRMRRRHRPDKARQWPSKMPWCSRSACETCLVSARRSPPSNALRRRRVERIVAQGARSSSSKAAGPIGRVLRDRALPLVFRYLVTERSMSWLYEHHVEWDRPVTADQRVA